MAVWPWTGLAGAPVTGGGPLAGGRRTDVDDEGHGLGQPRPTGSAAGIGISGMGLRRGTELAARPDVDARGFGVGTPRSSRSGAGLAPGRAQTVPAGCVGWAGVAGPAAGGVAMVPLVAVQPIGPTAYGPAVAVPAGWAGGVHVPGGGYGVGLLPLLGPAPAQPHFIPLNPYHNPNLN